MDGREEPGGASERTRERPPGVLLLDTLTRPEVINQSSGVFFLDSLDFPGISLFRLCYIPVLDAVFFFSFPCSFFLFELLLIFVFLYGFIVLCGGSGRRMLYAVGTLKAATQKRKKVENTHGRVRGFRGAKANNVCVPINVHGSPTIPVRDESTGNGRLLGGY